jgi:hypothetical protein
LPHDSLDYLCPFSAKISRSLAEHVVPRSFESFTLGRLMVVLKLTPRTPLARALRSELQEGGKLSGRVQLVLRLTPQPWHATSTLLHEVALAFGRLAPERFWPFSQALMDGQEAFFDRPAAYVLLRPNLSDA